MRPLVRVPAPEKSPTRMLLPAALGAPSISTTLRRACAAAGASAASKNRATIAPRIPLLIAIPRNPDMQPDGLTPQEVAGGRRTPFSVSPSDQIQVFPDERLRMNDESLISGWWVFAGVLLLVTGVLNIIYGIASIGDSKFFTEGGVYVLSGLHTWGWILLIVGVLELVAAF